MDNQGRSKKQIETNYLLTAVSLIGLLVSIILIVISK